MQNAFLKGTEKMSEQSVNDILSGGGLSSLLQNPEIAAKLPRIMEALGPVMAEMRAEKGAEAGQDMPTFSDKSSENDVSAEDVAAIVKGKRPSSSRRLALLKALEPYLSDSRREAMGYIMKVTSLIDILSEVM